jgi:hypothetical protein
MYRKNSIPYLSSRLFVKGQKNNRVYAVFLEGKCLILDLRRETPGTVRTFEEITI